MNKKITLPESPLRRIGEIVYSLEPLDFEFYGLEPVLEFRDKLEKMCRAFIESEKEAAASQIVPHKKFSATLFQERVQGKGVQFLIAVD